MEKMEIMNARLESFNSDASVSSSLIIMVERPKPSSKRQRRRYTVDNSRPTAGNRREW